MSKPQFITFTASIDAYVTDNRVRQFDRAMRKGDHVEALDNISISAQDMTTVGGPWIKIGTAEITVTMLPNFDLRHEQIKILEAALQQDRAESHARQTAMLGEINKLRAIENSGSAS